MSKILLVAGGVLNALFFLFHLLLGYQIHHLGQLAPQYRALMEALNVGGVLFIFFFAYVSFFHGKELLETRLGQVVVLLVAALYLSRAAEEFFLFRFTAAIFGSCALVAAIYIALFVIAVKQRNKPPLTRGTPGVSSATDAPKLRPAA